MHHSKMEKDPDSLIRRYQRAKQRRGNWESHWAEQSSTSEEYWSGARFWVSATIGVPIAVGTGLALVFFLTLMEPVPPDDDGYPLTVQTK